MDYTTNAQYLDTKEPQIAQIDTLPIGKIYDQILNTVATGKAVMVMFVKIMQLMRTLAVHRVPP